MLLHDISEDKDRLLSSTLPKTVVNIKKVQSVVTQKSAIAQPRKVRNLTSI